MDTGKKPQSHGKKVSQTGVTVHKTEKVDTQNRPVGSGARPSASQGSRPSSGGNRAVRRAAGGGSSIFLIVVAFLLLRSCMGGGSSYIENSGSGSAGSANTQVVTATAAPVVTQAPVAATPAPTAVPSNVAASIRDKRYAPRSGDSVTIMVYMCGTDLESNYGMATSDLQEMASATIGSNVNVIVETGGCKMWKNRIVSNSSNQIYKVETGGVRLVKDLGRIKSMVAPDTLTEFIQFCQTNYPAERNILIFWDHGGGSISGYGYDELQSRSAGSMDLAEVSAALKAANCTFDWIGFDACLMATLETAMVCNDYADYLIASEESEPGTGWYYTNWLTMLSQNTAIDTVTLAKKLIDDFVSTSTQASASAQVSLSIIDLAEMQGTVPPALNSFATSTTALLNSSKYATVSNARAGARQFARSSRINQIDLVHFAQRLGTAEGDALAKALKGCVKWNKTNISNANGVSIYFPYESTSAVKTAISTYNQVGMDAAYTKCISSFASLASSGQLASSAGSYGSSYGSGGSLDLGSLLGAYLGSGSTSSNSGSYSSYGASPLDALLGGGSSSQSSGIDMNSMMQLIGALAGGRSMPAEMDWFDAETVARNADYLAENYIDPADLQLTVRPDGTRSVALTEAQWEDLTAVELNVYVDDGEGFIDLGLDNYYDTDGEDLLVDFDGTWMTVNGQIVAYYSDTTEDDEFSTGHIPARLTTTKPVELPLAGEGGTSSQGETFTQLVYLEVAFDADDNAIITGARPMYDDETDAVAKGNIAIGAGDKLEFLCDYYTYDGALDSAYRLGEPLTVGADGLHAIYAPLLDVRGSYTYRMTDIYGNHFWTPAVEY